MKIASTILVVGVLIYLVYKEYNLILVIILGITVIAITNSNIRMETLLSNYSSFIGNFIIKHFILFGVNALLG